MNDMAYGNDSQAHVKSAQVRSEDHSVIIDTSNDTSEPKNYLCAHCNTKLFPFTQEDKLGGYLCIKCQIEYWPNQQPVKKANRFETPGPATDEHGNVLGDIDIPIVMMDNPEPSSTNYKQKKIAAAYEAPKQIWIQVQYLRRKVKLQGDSAYIESQKEIEKA